jgi:hypothetical protein
MPGTFVFGKGGRYRFLIDGDFSRCTDAPLAIYQSILLALRRVIVIMKPAGHFFQIRQRHGLLWLNGAALLIFTIIGCSGGSGSQPASTDDSTSQTAFPAALAVASPLDWSSSSAGGARARGALERAVPAGETGSQYDAAIAAINGILTGTSASSCTFDPELFFQMVINAGCYGPVVKYENHPDAPTPNNGELPPGDTGIWMEVDPLTGDACAAAELNARMEGIQARSLGALSGLASMVCTINASGGSLSLPDATNASVDLTSAMTAPDGVTFNSVVLAYATTTDGEAKYTYNLDFDYDTDHIVVELAHIPDATSTDVYRGQLTYRISTATDGGSNCPAVSGSTPVTRNGSLVYNRTDASTMTMEMREAQFCGSETKGLDSDKIVDAANEFDPVSAPDGWGDDFNLFRTEFDPSTLLGNYAYFWQAGHGDGNTRVFNLRVYDDGDDATEDLSATAFFGYGIDAENADPSIHGFIFNWAGPGNNHDLQEYAQEQAVSYNAATGKFDSVGANIHYAPTTTGNYDGSGSFTYDSDADGLVDTIPGNSINQDLAVSTDDGTGTFTIEQTIVGAGIVVPGQPDCSECAP